MFSGLMRFSGLTRRILLVLVPFLLATQVTHAAELKILFLGDNGHHQPPARFAQLRPVLAERGIALTYTDKMTDLSSENLARYDALLLYANIDEIAPEQAEAVLAYVAKGGGFVPLHCASFCFRNSPDMVALMGAQFLRHGTGVFRTEIALPDHPLMKGFGGFESWDETYVHHLHNETHRTVLTYRVDSEGREPWTWIRTHGDGRVFYTAWGHDHRTWGNPGFQNLVERGIRWATKQDLSVVPDYLADQPFPVPDMTEKRTDVAPFEYEDVGAKIPNYVASDRWGTLGEPMSLMQKPLPAEESEKHWVLPEGFRAELFVGDPDLQGKPLCMAWDEKGRLWVAETYDYPNELQPAGEGRDRIRICEDTDGDWKADKFTVFAEQLSIPTSITFHRGGAIVQDGTQTLFLKDTDGDDVADERTVLFEGWNQGDTHGGVSNFQYGLDNWIWAMQGYNHSEPTNGNERFPGFRMGFFRFRPDGSDVEFIRSTDNNTWGLGISEEGLIFGSTANRNPSVFMPIPNRYYEQVRGWTTSLTLGTIANTFLFQPVTDKVRQVDQHGGYTAGAGHALYTARRYPQEYWNRTAFVNGPTGHLVGTFVLRPDGAGFQSAYSFNLAASDDEWSAPIMSEVGPDGNVWMLDWYNFIVQHNPTPAGFETGKGNAYETDLRDKRHGRIYRIVYDPAGAAESFKLDADDPAALVETLKNDNLLWRRHAQRLLVERGGTDVVPALIELLRDTSVDSLGLNVGAIHALWTLHGLHVLDGSHTQALAAATKALQHPSAGVRRNAVAVLPVRESSAEAIRDINMLADRDAQVRLAALLALAEMPASPRTAGAVARFVQNESQMQDRWLRDAATAAAATQGAEFLQQLVGPDPAPESLAQVVRVVAEHYARGNPGNEAAGLLAKLADAHTSLVTPIIAGVSAGWDASQSIEIDDETLERLEHLMQRLPTADRGQLVRLGSRWGIERFQKYAAETVAQLLHEVDRSDLSVEQRIQFARQLFEFQPQSDELVSQLLERITPQLPPELANGLIQAMGLSEAPQLGALLTGNFQTLAPSARREAVAVMLRRAPATEALLAAIDSGSLQLTELSLDQRQALASHPEPSIRRTAREIFGRGGALPNPDRQRVLDGLHHLTEESGDPVAGKLAFTKVCAKCHMHSGEGNRIGPDLTGMAVHPKHELLTHILDPNRSVESNFRTYTVVTSQGLVLSGMLASESRTALELFNAEGEKKTVLREDVEELIASTQSLMPEGFEKQLTEVELRDLLEFLTQRGKYVPVDLSKVATICSDRSMFENPENTLERLIFDDWSAKEVQGVPFVLVDPRDGRVPNVILLRGPNGEICRRMPRSVTVPAGGSVRTIHLLSGVSGWGYPYGEEGSVSMIVRLHYADGGTEEHPLKNGIHFADYIRHVDVPGSHLAFHLQGRQIRYLTVNPDRPEPIDHIEFVKGSDRSAPVVMAVTLESR
jgi:putative membrane-bound dehydrogenase-like protein